MKCNVAPFNYELYFGWSIILKKIISDICCRLVFTVNPPMTAKGKKLKNQNILANQTQTKIRFYIHL